MLFLCYSFSKAQEKTDTIPVDDTTEIQVTSFALDTTVFKPSDSSLSRKEEKKSRKAQKRELELANQSPEDRYWDSLRTFHSPRRAALYSAVFPGLGQIYNHQYLKVPFMWAGVGVAAGVFIFNFDHYITFRDAYRLSLQGKPIPDPQLSLYTQQDLKVIRDGYRRYVDYSVLGFAVVYLYNVIDAVVFGHLYNFDISDPKVGLKFGPVLHEDESYVGLGFTYNF